MDETRFQSPNLSSETPPFYPPHRRRPLRSDTYRTMLRIFSQCFDESLASRNIDSKLNTENGGCELGLQSEERATQPVGLACGKIAEVNLNGNDKGSEQMSIDQIEELMGLEENVDSLIQKDVDSGSHPEKMLMDELEHIVQGSEDVGHENHLTPFGDPLQRSQICVDESSNKEGEHERLKQMDVSGAASETVSCSDNIATGGNALPRENDKDNQSVIPRKQEIAEPPNFVSESNNSIISTLGDLEVEDYCTQLVSEAINLCMEKNPVADISNLCNMDDDKRSQRTNSLKHEQEMQLKDNGDMLNNGDYSTEAMEEGEITGDCIMDEDISMDVLLEDAEMQDVKVNDMPINGCASVTDRNEVVCNEANDRDSKNSFVGVDSIETTNIIVGLGESDRNKAINVPDVFLREKTPVGTNDPKLDAQKIEKEINNGRNSLLSYEDIFEEDAAIRNKTSTEKRDVETCMKKKKGSSSRKSKARKKAQERKKRAEKNKQLGVRRLKIHSISIPKPIQYCNHYLHGRCREGDKCKFSHDVVPLTKSKPCSHFARNTCLKGDDCPFDHELSKYPCSNFASNGFCKRGNNCLFSHKIQQSTEDSAITSQLIADDSTAKQQKNNNGASQCISSMSSFCTKMFSHKSIEKNSNETVLKESELVAKGTNFVTVENSSMVDKLKQPNLFPSGNAEAKAGIPIYRQGSAQKSTDVLNRTPPVVAPKGISFLSFGQAQQDQSGEKLGGPFSGGDNGAKSASNHSSPPIQYSSASFSDSTTKVIQPAVVPKGINFLAFGNPANKLPNQPSSASVLDLIPNGTNFITFGKNSIDDSSSKGKAKLVPNMNDGIDSCVQVQQQNATEKPQKSSISSVLPSSSISLIQSLGSSASKIYTDTPNSAQKALFSTLAFAARYESRMRLNQSTHAPVVGNEMGNESISNSMIGGVQDPLPKPSKLSEFLASIGNMSSNV